MRNCIIWVRKEKPLTLNWAGKYEEGFVQNSAGEFRLTPRKSFELWTESWKGRCATWTNVEIGIASMLTLALPESLATKVKTEEEQKILREAEESLRITASVFDSSQEAIFITDSENNIIDANLAFTQITGYSREDVLGKNPKILSSGHQKKEFYAQLWETLKRDNAWRGEIWNRRKSGDIYPEMLSISALCDNDGKVLRHVAVFSDISHLKEHEAELTRVAHYDPLTSIPNRLLLADRMKQGISQTSRDQNMMAVCYLDLDGFKLINDTMGHEVGDAILVEVSKRIENTIRGGDTVARLGGDEFVILLLGLEKGEESLATLERLLKSISDPIIVQNKTLKISASIGVSIYPSDNEDPDTLLRHADQAMYVAKESGKNRYHIYDVEMDKRSRFQNTFLQSIRHALEQNQFELYYQPKINLRTKELVGAEALIRWRHPERGILPPSEFLRQIENTVLDIEIGEWVTKTALAQLEQWRKVGLDVEISINISGYHLESNGFAEKLKQHLSHYPNLPADKLQIEVLETVALNDINVVREIIGACRELGVSFALDDFGTGYSSLSYLNALPVDALKIDQTFVRDMLEDEGDRAIVVGVIALAKAFRRQTIAEGIESKAHIQVLDGMGCELGQGYGIARPMPANELVTWEAKYK
jgi:diguanylate cyclase (GGDEF)-like protein/PAS domain S-box-containing protein